MKRTVSALVASAALVLALAGPAAAAPPNQVGVGLVNVIIDDVTIQVPVALALNLCDTTVNLLAVNVETGAVECTATADSMASNGKGGGNGGA